MIIVPREERFTGLTPRSPWLPPEPVEKPAAPFIPSFSLGIGGQTIVQYGDQKKIEGPTIGEAAFGLGNDVVNALDWLERPRYKPDPAYNPMNDPAFKGTEYERRYSDNFVASQSADETQAIIGRINKENQYRDVLANSGWKGFVAGMAAGALSPTMLIPVAGWLRAGAGAGRGAAIALRAVETGAMVAGAVGLQEGALQSMQETRTAAESLWAIGGSAVLGSVLGAAAGGLSRGEFAAMAEKARAGVPGDRQGVADLMDQAAGRPISAGAAAVDMGSSKYASALGFEKTPIRNQDPLFRSLSSPFPTQGVVARTLAEVPGTIEANARGIPTVEGGSVEYLSHSYDYALADAIDHAEGQFSTYRFGRDVSFARLRAGFGGGKPGAMSYRDFMEAVYEAMHTGDVSPIPEVRATAEYFRKNVEDPMKNAAIEARIFPDDVKPGDDVSHVYRLWDPDVVAARRTELEGILAKDFGERIAGLARQVEDLRAKGEKVDPELIKAAELSAQEVKGLAEDSVNTILGFSPQRGMLPRDIMAGPRGPLKERMLRIATGKVKDFVIRDPRHVERLMVRTMATDIALMKKGLMPGTMLEGQMAKINDEASRLAARAEEMVTKPGMTPDQITAKAKEFRKWVAAQQKNAHRDIIAMVERLRGTYALPRHPNGLLHRAVRTIKQLNLLAKLGNITVSSASDVGKVVMNYGLGTVMKTAWHPFIHGLKTVKLAGREGKLANAILDLISHDRTMAINDVMDSFGRGSKFERGVQWMTDKFGHLSLMDHWNNTLKQFAAIGAQTKLLEAAEAVAKGKQTGKQIEYLAANGIDREMGGRIAQQFGKHGVTEGSLKWAATEKWTDKQAVNAMRAALHREILRTIVVPGQDKPLWMSTELGSLVGQFHSFAVASVQRTMLTGLQQRDMAALNGALFMMALGAVSYAVKTKVSGRELTDDPRVWVANAFDQSGLAGWAMDANNIVETLTRGRVGVSMLTGQRISRYAALSKINAMFGPTAGTIEDVAKLSGNIWASVFPDAENPQRFGASDVHAIRKMIPFNNLFYLRWLFDQAEHGTNSVAGIPERKQ